ncbi:MAG: hypothetical protein JWP29_5559 [Rhodoferax sp.]|nr:hypothetical protein [Rhodoferax sp.]
MKSFCALSFDVSAAPIANDFCLPAIASGDVDLRYIALEGKSVLSVDIPKNSVGAGISYMRFLPLAAMGRMKLGGKRCLILMDPCSNASLIDEELFYKSYPEGKVTSAGRMEIQGVGKKSTLGWAVVPVFLEGYDTRTKDAPILARLHIEVHLIKNFKPGLLFGMDALSDYGVELDLVKRSATLRHYDFRYNLIYSRAFNDSPVKVSVANNTTIAANTVCCVPVSSSMVSGYDYIMRPWLCWSQGTTPLIQLPICLLDSDSSSVMFRNATNEAVHLPKHLTIGEASIVESGAVYTKTGEFIDWKEMGNRDSKPHFNSGSTPPTHFVDNDVEEPKVKIEKTIKVEKGYDDAMLSLVAVAPSPPTKPRSIDEAKVKEISAKADVRERSETFPDEDDDEELPSAPEGAHINDGLTLKDILIVDKGLNASYRKELMTLLLSHEEAFSVHGEIGNIKGMRVTIPTVGDLPPPQSLRPMSSAKKQVVEDSIREFEK